MVRFRLGTILFLPSLVLGADEFWTKLEARQWAEPDIKKMVTSSPWAKQASVRVHGEGPISDAYRSPNVGTPPSIGEQGVENRAEERLRTGRSEGQRGSSEPWMVVRWDSAAPVREACASGGFERYLFSCYSKLMYLSGQSSKFQELTKTFYILSLSDYPKAALPSRDREAPQHSSQANAALERMGRHLQERTILKRKGNTSLLPAQVVVLPAGQTLLVIIFFPRSAALALDDKEVVLEVSDKELDVKSRFNLTKMIYQGRLDS